jgi:hypothetical protein
MATFVFNGPFASRISFCFNLANAVQSEKFTQQAKL